jgi:hypothetical protein
MSIGKTLGHADILLFFISPSATPNRKFSKEQENAI